MKPTQTVDEFVARWVCTHTGATKEGLQVIKGTMKRDLRWLLNIERQKELKRIENAFDVTFPKK